MPNYTYKCLNQDCEHNKGFDVRLRLSEHPLKECPECSSKVKQVFEPVNSIWKCDGCYIKDSKRK